MARIFLTSPTRRNLLSAIWFSLLAAVAGLSPANDPAAPPSAELPADKDRVVGGGQLNEGRLIRVRLPLVGNADAQIQSSIERAIGDLGRGPRQPGKRPILVLELAAGRRDGFGEGTDFARALKLAQFLTSQDASAVKTVAYIPRTIKGHGVLVALACEEIVMDPEAEIGEAGIDEKDREVEPGVLRFYEQIASARRTVPEAIAIGMLDRRQELLKVETDQEVEFVLRDGLEKLKREHAIVSEETLVPRGSLGLFTGREGREYGFVKLLAANRDALARGLGLPAQAVMEDQALVGNWRPVMINLEGPITPRSVQQVHTLIGREIEEHHVNWIGLRIDSTGGNVEDCLLLAGTLAELDANEVRTVAYVPLEASGGAAIVALSCDQLVMQPEAHLGGRGTVNVDRPTLESAEVTIRGSLAAEAEQSWSLLAAMLDGNLPVFSYQNTKTGETRLFSAQEAAEQKDAKDWTQGAKITTDGEPLRLGSRKAEELGLAWHVVENFDDLKQLYGFEHDPRVAEPNWALELVEALSSPALTVLLLVIGFVGLYIELHSPGVGVGGFIATVAFMLFFWSKFLHNTAGWLEVILFLGGVCCLLFELLVLPGFGVFGLGGGALILSSIVLASQTFILPQTESQLSELRQSLTVVTAATVCVVVMAFALRNYLPQARLFRTLMLEPPANEELEDLAYRESLADFSHLIGQTGTTATILRPAGKAEFDGHLVDVLTEGVPIERGRAVVVVKARGSRVVVREVEA